MDELARFLINSTVGIIGWNDIAKEHLNIPQRDEDLGQTLGHYGIGSGFYLVLPVLGPSNARDLLGKFGDSFANPISYVEPTHDSIGIKAYETLNTFSFHYKEYEQLKKDVIDIYPLMRDIYESRRDALIKE
jgi:phospholipid-binding lipoprotein MlaA